MTLNNLKTLKQVTTDEIEKQNKRRELIRKIKNFIFNLFKGKE